MKEKNKNPFIPPDVKGNKRKKRRKTKSKNTWTRGRGRAAWPAFRRR
jgi:hypothetical protein